MRSNNRLPRLSLGASLFTLFLLVIPACGDLAAPDGPSSGKGLSELCQQSSECSTNYCINVAGLPDEHHNQCAAACTTDADCEKIDPRAVCHQACVLGCGKPSDCPAGASCSATIGGGCYQN